MSSLSWHEQAACQAPTVDPDWFFPERGKSARFAREVCAMCPVKAECLDFALRHHEVYGVWGGTTDQKRREMRRQGRSLERVA